MVERNRGSGTALHVTLVNTLDGPQVEESVRGGVGVGIPGKNGCHAQRAGCSSMQGGDELVTGHDYAAVVDGATAVAFDDRASTRAPIAHALIQSRRSAGCRTRCCSNSNLKHDEKWDARVVGDGDCALQRQGLDSLVVLDAGNHARADVLAVFEQASRPCVRDELRQNRTGRRAGR